MSTFLDYQSVFNILTDRDLTKDLTFEEANFQRIVDEVEKKISSWMRNLGVSIPVDFDSLSEQLQLVVRFCVQSEMALSRVGTNPQQQADGGIYDQYLEKYKIYNSLCEKEKGNTSISDLKNDYTETNSGSVVFFGRQ